MFNLKKIKVLIEKIEGFFFFLEKIEVFLLCEDEIYLLVFGNKFRKLKYIIKEVKCFNKKGIVSFGGVFLNYIVVFVVVGKEIGIFIVGIIRGEELKDKIEENFMLLFVKDCGM